LQCPHCGKEINEITPFQALRPFKVLFDKTGTSIGIPSIKHELSDFSESYDLVVKKIIANSINMNESTFRLNVTNLLPSFGMTRRGFFHGLKTKRNIITDPNHVLDTCWLEVKDGLPDIKKLVEENAIHKRSRAVLEMSTKSSNYIVSKSSELFDKLEWTTIKGRNVGRVAASKILFAVLPEIALPVDNAEWDSVFRTHSYGRVLSTMIEEINQWEAISKTHLETLSSYPQATLPSIYNVMAMAARPLPAKRKKKRTTRTKG
jgi:hypothetical protein